MRLIKPFLLMSMLFFFSGCKKFLESTPTDFLAPSNYFENEEQLNFALNAVYDVLGNSKLYGAQLHSRHNMQADEGFYNGSTLLIGPEVYNFEAMDGELEHFWRQLYNGVARANTLIKNVNNNQAIPIEVRNRVRGEALFLRAYYYFLLVQNYGDVPLLVNPTGSSKDVNIPQTAAKEVYLQIIADMKEAEALVLPISEIGHGGRVSKSAVRGVLARVCLHMAGKPVEEKSMYQEAKIWLEKIITENEHSLNPSYDQVFINYAADIYDIKESIWEVEFWGNSAGSFVESGYVGSWIGVRNTATTNDIGYSFGRILATGKHYRTYETGDLRRNWNIVPFAYRADGSKSNYPANPTTAQQYVRNAGKYRREYEVVLPKSSQLTPINFPLLRYADILLMYAEVLNELEGGPSVEAFHAINQVRRRGFGKLLPNANPSTIASNDLKESQITGDAKAWFFEELVKERTRELCFEALRRPDLIRWGIFLPTMKANLAMMNTDLGSTAWQSLTYRNVQDKHVIYPIPARELELNKELVQHSLWR